MAFLRYLVVQIWAHELEESEPTQPSPTTEANKEEEDTEVYDRDYEEADEVDTSL